MFDSYHLLPAWQWYAAAAVFGALWGSFANVVIVRWPREMSVLRPASHCISCGKPVRWYDNVPIVSFLVLRGRCRECKARFSPRYVVVEAALALLSVGVIRLTLLADPPSFQQGLAEYFVLFAFCWAMVTAGLIDLETYWIPDVIPLPGIAVGLAANAFLLDLGWREPLIAAVGGYAAIRLLFVDGYRLLTGKPGMGEGDARLVAMIGAFFGIRGALFALFAGAIQGLIAGVVIRARRRRGLDSEPVFEEEIGEEEREQDGERPATDPGFLKSRIPFGPFLALGALEHLFVGPWVVERYTAGIARLLGME
jgi:leader peptidase (prepilin peptidase) / N-methyltransferase